VRKRKPGTTLAVAIPEHWPRWVNPLLFFVFGSALVLPCIFFAVRPYKTFGLLEVLAAILGAVFLVLFGRLVILGRLTGDTTVEISKEPALRGEPLDYFILQKRAASSITSMEARLQARRYTRGSIFRLEADVPLAAATMEPDGRRKIAGSVVVPAAGDEPTRPLEWLILVTFRFRSGNEHPEDRLIRVEPK